MSLAVIGASRFLLALVGVLRKRVTYKAITGSELRKRAEKAMPSKDALDVRR